MKNQGKREFQQSHQWRIFCSMGLRRRPLGGYDRGKMAHRLSGAGAPHHGADAPRLPNKACLPGRAVWRLEFFAGYVDKAPPDAEIQGIERFQAG